MTQKESSINSSLHVQTSDPFSISPYKKTKHHFSPHKSYKLEKIKTISFYETGIKIDAIKYMPSEKSKSNLIVKGNQITSWSRDSRKRMRDFLLTRSIENKELLIAGVTLTIPGSILPLEHVKKLFNHFQISFKRKNNCAVWRLEKQVRGQIHWHLLAGLKSSEVEIRQMWLNCLKNLGVIRLENFSPVSAKTGEFTPFSIPNSDRKSKSEFIASQITIDSINDLKCYKGISLYKCSFWGNTKTFFFTSKSKNKINDFLSKIIKGNDKILFLRTEAKKVSIKGKYSYKEINDVWVKVYDIVGIIEGYPVNALRNELNEQYSGFQILIEKDYSKVLGAEKYSVKIDYEKDQSNRSKFYRYLNDHASKSKQEQLAENVGRHWGVINREQFSDDKPLKKYKFYDDKHMHAFLRVYRRLRTPMIRCDKVPNFRRKLGFKPSKADIGTRCFFCSTETIEKIFKWSLNDLKNRLNNALKA